jgi:hypothetical protein
MMRALRVLLIVDAAVLFLLGLLLIFAPRQVADAFHFRNVSAGMNYVIALWGCALATLAMGYVVAAQDPIRHTVWVQVGIARGALECLLGVVYLSRGVLSFRQAVVGIVLPGLLAVAYLLLYPRDRPVPHEGETAPA